ncbi:hypothetical protein RB595_000767 [Gaeumannomyces hyphopodioides]
MSKVGNLRAMFENKGDTSPPERGRSPGLSSAGAESPRPLSKIRTNFVAIEKDGRIGLQRDPSSDSVLSISRKPDGEGEAFASVPQENPPSFADRIKSTRAGLQMETIPQSPPQDMSSTFPSIAPAIQPAAPSPDKVGDTEDKALGKAPAAESKDTKDASRSGTPKPVKKDQSEGVNGKTVERDKTKSASRDASKGTGSSKLAAPRPAAINTSKTTTRAPAKSPNNLKTPTSPVKGTKLPTKTPERKTLHADKTTTPKATPKAKTAVSKTGAAEASASATKKPPVLQASPAGSIDRGLGFTKPKVKSPTRPVPLPAGLTTHTTASATRQSLSRQSGVLLSAQPAQGRSPSRTSVSTTGGSSSGKTLRRQSSTINRPRPSLGPPPKQHAVDHPVTRREREVDEGFLARMMRPTQASSSKTHEKVVSPPRKAPGALPATKRAVGKDATAEIKKAPAKPDFAAPKKSIPRPTPTKSASKTTDKKTTAAAPATDKKAASQPEPKAVVTPEAEKAEAEIAKPETVEEKTAETAAPKPVEEAIKDVVSEQEPVEQDKVESELEIEQSVGSVDAAPAPVASPPADVSVEETASEAEPAEPNTPAETTEALQDSGATTLVTDGADVKVVEEDKTVLEVEKQSDSIPVAE